MRDKKRETSYNREFKGTATVDRVELNVVVVNKVKYPTDMRELGLG